MDEVFFVDVGALFTYQWLINLDLAFHTQFWPCFFPRAVLQRRKTALGKSMAARWHFFRFAKKMLFVNARYVKSKNLGDFVPKPLPGAIIAPEPP
ncbi:MAG: hypothetical protein H7834_15305 [Magnetococcus sp. YQC-9]